MDVLEKLRRSWRRVVFLLNRGRFERELQEEFETHQRMKLEELRMRASNAEAAVEQSRKEMGNLTFNREECRNMWSFLSLQRFVQDLRYAARMFRRTPVFTTVAVASLALGIGGNAAMFSLVDAVLLRPLPYFAPERLVRISGTYPRAAVPFFEQHTHALEMAGVSTGSEMNLSRYGSAMRVVASSVSCNFLNVLGSRVARGRGFEQGEDVPGHDGVALISYSLWKEKFGADPGVIGRMVELNGTERQIAGVMPKGFSYPSARVQVWIPMRLDPSNFLEYWGGEFVPLIGRLRPDATLATAQSQAARLTAEFRKTFPYPMDRSWNADTRVIPLQRDMVGDVREKLIILLAAVGMVLLIACANVASLLLSRATTRRREIALRASLGASRLRVVRQLLTESAALALLGAVVGLALGTGALAIFKSVLPASLPGVQQAAIDWQVAGAVTILACLCGIVFGLAPALSASQVDLAAVLKTGSQRSTSTLWVRLRSALIVAEVALTLVLAVAAGLLLKSLYQLANSSPGFEPDHILTVRVSPNQSSCAQRSACVALYARLLDEATKLHSVRAAAIANSLPLEGDLPTLPVDVEDHPKTADHPAPMLWFGAVSPDYFRMLQIRLLAGRYLARGDELTAQPVAVISASTARRFWPHESAIGKHMKPTLASNWRTIVGVVADTHQYTLATALPDWVQGEIYLPYAQSQREDGPRPSGAATPRPTRAWT
jgi:predicted permease